MSAEDIVARMWPMWVLGIFMILIAVFSSNRDLLRIDKKGIWKWIKFLAYISVLRFVVFYIAWDFLKDTFADVSWLPLSTTATVFWEDAFYSLPLLMLARQLGESRKWFQYGSMALLSLAFGSGHIYQGFGAVAMLTCYVPITNKLAKKYGIGTIMAGHVMYDMSTLGLIKLMLGFMHG